MNKYLAAFIPVFVFIFHVAQSQGLVVKKDLSADWQFVDQGKFHPYRQNEGSVSVVYVKLKVPHPNGEYLAVKGTEKMYLFVNNKLAANGHNMVLRLDSLAQVYATPELLIGVYQEGLSYESLETHLLSREMTTTSSKVEPTRPSFFVRDFGILGALILAIFLVIVIRLNSKLASDYFSLGKIFSLREDESQLLTRIGNSTNILFYIYCSLLLGYFFIIVFNFLPDTYHITLFFKAQTFGGIFLQWLKLSSMVLLLLVAKIVLVLNLSYLFAITEVGGLHFFNWVRWIVVFFGALTGVVFIYFVSHGYEESVHALFLKLVVWFTAGWMILIFLKLVGKANASLFHLFSYICATELIPFLLIVKVLYN